MRIGLIIYGSLDTLTGGYLYDRLLVEHLRRQGDHVDIISLPWRTYGRHLGTTSPSTCMDACATPPLMRCCRMSSIIRRCSG